MLKNSHVLMMISTIGTFGLLYMLMFLPIPKDNSQLLLAIVGPLLGFYFGSSVNKQPVVSPAPPVDPSIAALTKYTADLTDALNTNKE